MCFYDCIAGFWAIVLISLSGHLESLHYCSTRSAAFGSNWFDNVFSKGNIFHKVLEVPLEVPHVMDCIDDVVDYIRRYKVVGSNYVGVMWLVHWQGSSLLDTRSCAYPIDP